MGWRRVGRWDGKKTRRETKLQEAGEETVCRGTKSGTRRRERRTREQGPRRAATLMHEGGEQEKGRGERRERESKCGGALLFDRLVEYQVHKLVEAAERAGDVAVAVELDCAQNKARTR
eukprot:6213196-Pleurochrysis_carterae.AAC.3